MRTSHPESNEWRHYEASEAALKRAADVLQAARNIFRALRKQFPGVDESTEYAQLRTELKSELDKRIKTVLERVCEHARRMDTLAATNWAANGAASVSEPVLVSETIIKQIDGAD